METFTKSIPFDPLSAKRRLAPMVQTLLSRTYEGGIYRIVNLNSDNSGDIIGNAIGNDRKFLDFEVNFSRNEVNFGESARHDSYFEGLNLTRFDFKFKEPKCRVGVRCKGSCIERGKKCRTQLTQVARPNEISAMQSLSLMTKGISPPKQVDDLEEKTIRDLQEIARNQGVYRANHQSKGELIKTLRTLQSDPESQERLRKTLEQRRTSRKLLEKSLPGQLARYWRNLQQITKAAGISPELGAVAATVFLAGTTAAAYGQMRDRYRSNLSESANMALERAEKIPIDNTNKPNVMFAVGGFGGIGSNGQKMKEMLETPQDNSKGEGWFKNNNHIIPFTHKEIDIPTPSVSKFNADGGYNPAYLGAVAQAGFGKFVGNFQKGRNEGAVDLAAQLYAYGTKYKDKGLNVLGHGAAPTDEAIEILSRMPKGREIAERLNLVRLGTPSFGFTDDKMWDKAINHRTITSDGDPFSFLPKKAAQFISSVQGHEPENYLKNVDVRERLRESFNYYSSSITGTKAWEQRNKEFRGVFGEALNAVTPTAGKLWNQINRVQDMAKRNPAAAVILGGAVTAATGVATYKKMQGNYRKGLGYSAVEAQKLVEIEKQKLKAPGAYVRHGSATFVVGGIGFAAKDIKDNLPDELKNTHFVEVDGAIATSGNANIGEMTPGSAGYNTHVIANGYGTHLNRNLKESMPVVGSGKIRNEEAVQLAAQMYAMADTRFGGSGGGKGRKVDVNIIAGGDGGLVAREALQIIQKMPNGQRIADRIRLVTLGTPTFGLAEETIQEKNIMGADDPVGKLPHHQAPISTSAAGVQTHSAKDYLQNQAVQSELKNHFQRPKRELTQAEIQERERKAKARETEQKRQQAEVEEQQLKAKREANKQQREANKQKTEAQEAADREQKERDRLEKYKLSNLPPDLQQKFLNSVGRNFDPNNKDHIKKLSKILSDERRYQSRIEAIQKANQGYTPPKPKQ